MRADSVRGSPPPLLGVPGLDSLRLYCSLDELRPYEEFEAGWSQRKPPEEILEFFGSWPDGAVVNPLIRM